MTDLHLHGDELARGARDDLAVNVVAGGPRPWLRSALAAALDHLGAYPDEAAATAAVAARHGRGLKEVVLLNGASQAFWLAAALGPRRPVCVHPSFTEPDVALRAARRPPRHVVLDQPWALSPDDIPDDADLVVVGNPTNPTGVLHPRAALAALCRPGRVTLVDESFMDFVPGEPETLAAQRELPGLVVVRSLTKLHAIPGLRAGYLLAPAPLAARLRAQRAAWSVNALALAAIEAIVSRPDHAAAIARNTAGQRADLVARLRHLPGATVHPGAANFVLLDLPGGDSAARRLREQGIAVRPCASFPGLTADHLRLTVRDSATHARAVDALGACALPGHDGLAVGDAQQHAVAAMEDLDAHEVAAHVHGRG
jgi:histidinol-phosphate aminotransferase